jgi:pyruvate/2-oxoglutarate/acetoin dehydrogenase E1 component
MAVRELTYVEALNEALREEMRRDDSVIVFGEEVALAGGEVTHASKMRFTSGGQVKLPLVIRTQYSLGRSYGSQHTQFLAASFMQAPGLKIVLPSTPFDAKGLLKSAIRDDDPVLFIESGSLYVNKSYYGYRGPVPDEEYLIPIGKADVKREGTDVTVVALSRTVSEAVAAADRLREDGVGVEVVDLRTIQPMDYATVEKSVRKTNRLIVAEDSVKTCGVSAEVAAYIAEYALDALEAPIVRLNSPPMPTPQSASLEREYMVTSDKIVEAVKKLLK